MIRRGLFVVAVLALFAYEYQPFLSAGFVYEDDRWHDACLVTRNYVKPRGLTLLSWCWQHEVFPSAKAFHVVDLSLHLAVSLLVGALAWRLAGETAGAVAWMLALLHVLAMQGAGYLSNRGDLIAALGVLVACHAALSGLVWLAIVGLIGGLFGKESAITGLALVPLVRRQWQLSACMAGIVAMATAYLVWSQTLNLDGVSPFSWLLLQGTATTRLIAMVILPVGQTVDYDYANVPMGLQISALLALVWFVVSAIRLRRERPMIAMAMLWPVVAVVPRFIVGTPRNVLNEGQFYLALMGAILFGTVAAAQRWEWA